MVDAYNDREEELGSELMRALERFMLLQIIDERWREHLHDMDYLREGIHLRGFAQIDPLVAYKNEGFDMFTELMNNIWDEFARYVFNVEVEAQPPDPGQGNGTRWSAGANTSSSSSTARYNYAGGTAADQPSALAAAAAAGGAVPPGMAEAADYAADAVLEPPPVVETKRAGRARADRAQRPLLVRLGQEVQEVPWCGVDVRRLQWPPRPAEAARGLSLTPLS